MSENSLGTHSRSTPAERSSARSGRPSSNMCIRLLPSSSVTSRFCCQPGQLSAASTWIYYATVLQRANMQTKIMLQACWQAHWQGNQQTSSLCNHCINQAAASKNAVACFQRLTYMDKVHYAAHIICLSTNSCPVGAVLQRKRTAVPSQGGQSCAAAAN